MTDHHPVKVNAFFFMRVQRLSTERPNLIVVTQNGNTRGLVGTGHSAQTCFLVNTNRNCRLGEVRNPACSRFDESGLNASVADPLGNLAHEYLRNIVCRQTPKMRQNPQCLVGQPRYNNHI